jgi:hypothetical protein
VLSRLFSLLAILLLSDDTQQLFAARQKTKSHIIFNILIFITLNLCSRLSEAVFWVAAKKPQKYVNLLDWEHAFLLLLHPQFRISAE